LVITGDPGDGLFRHRWLKQTLRHVATAMDRPPQHPLIRLHFVKQDVPVERSKHQKKAPLAKTRMGKAAPRTETGMLAEQMAGGF
jgi:hypothetical protein